MQSSYKLASAVRAEARGRSAPASAENRHLQARRNEPRSVRHSVIKQERPGTKQAKQDPFSEWVRPAEASESTASSLLRIAYQQIAGNSG